MSLYAPRKMIQEFETIRQLGILLSSGRKQIPKATTKMWLSWSWKPAVNRQRVHAPIVSRTLDVPYFTVRQMFRWILHFYPYKTKTCNSRIRTQTFVKVLHFSFGG
ncbi:hypothetical protein TNIN_3001 [Trichonephila inaurata madagascariensis]|uniref:Uncharacterized protein n=1 Tax=Trichonephila inaurata madagascariensis TaxID=2747483 RepID=A0A8X7BNW6_9ARAC|nr:hypothetical protein TNIN_3001 [Trichonephila inaurata madagascariensis]